MLMTMAAWTCVAEARPPAQQVYERGLQGLSGGTSLSASEYEALLGLLGGNDTTRLTSLYRTSVHGTTYDDLLDRVGDAKPLVLVVRNGQYLFGAFINCGILLPDSPTGSSMYPCDVWYYSLAGHFEKPTKIEIPREGQIVHVAGKEGSALGANVRIGGYLHLAADSRGSRRPADDIRSCRQYTFSSSVRTSCMDTRQQTVADRDTQQMENLFRIHDQNMETIRCIGRQREEQQRRAIPDNLLGGSSEFMADEIEVLHLVQ